MRTFEEEVKFRDKSPIESVFFISFKESQNEWVGAGYKSPLADAELLKLKFGHPFIDSCDYQAVKCSGTGKRGILILDGSVGARIRGAIFEGGITWKNQHIKPGPDTGRAEYLLKKLIEEDSE